MIARSLKFPELHISLSEKGVHHGKHHGHDHQIVGEMLINHEINSRGTFFWESHRTKPCHGKYGFSKAQLIDQVERQTNIAMED